MHGPAAPEPDPVWVRKLRYRLDDFEATTRREGLSCSIKLRTRYGNFDRGNSPQAYAIIDRIVRDSGAVGRWVESHNNGPEVLTYLDDRESALGVKRSVLELLAGLANARADGIAQGDAERAPLDLLIRYFDSAGRYVEQTLCAVLVGPMLDAQAIGTVFERAGYAVAEK